MSLKTYLNGKRILVQQPGMTSSLMSSSLPNGAQDYSQKRHMAFSLTWISQSTRRVDISLCYCGNGFGLSRTSAFRKVIAVSVMPVKSGLMFVPANMCLAFFTHWSCTNTPAAVNS